MQRINKSTSSYLNFSSLNNYEILIRISFISRTNSKIDKLKIVYAKYFKENIDIYSKVLGLYCSSNNLSSYLNSRYNSPELKAALEFISLEVNNTNILKRRDAIDDKLDEFSDELDICKDKLELETLQLVNFSNDYKNEVDLWKNEKENWFLKKENEIKELKDMFNLRMQELEKIYNEKLRLEEPVKFWEKKANEKRWSFYFFLTATVILSIITLFIAASMIKDLYELSYTNEELRRFIPLSFMIIALVSFLIYLLRMSIKIMMSSKHLQTEYEQKATFTYFYLTLLNDSKTNGQIKDSEKNLIFQTLFSSPDTGLIKTSTNDSSDVMSLLTTIISKDNR